MRCVHALALSLILLARASPQAGGEEVKGEVFVVTRGGSNVLLGRVEVTAYDLTGTVEGIAKLSEEARPLFKRAKGAETAAKKVSDATGYSDPNHAELFEEYLDWGCVVKFLLSGLYYTSSLREAKAGTKTDSAGRYSLDLPPGRYAIAAKASRAVGENTEYYYWLVPCEVTPGKIQELTLSNDNQASSDSKESLIHTISAGLETDAPRGLVVMPPLLAKLAAAEAAVVKLTETKLAAAKLAAAKRAQPEPPKNVSRTAEESQRHAVETYPQLGVAGSDMNKAFVARVNRIKIADPDFFKDPDWPFRLAVEIVGK